MYRYWGKAQPKDGATQRYHLLVYHSLDVAAVGKGLLQRHPMLLAKLSAGLQVSTHWLEKALPFLLAMHDIGKFAETFQALQELLSRELLGREQTRFDGGRHDSLGYLLWNEVLGPELLAEGWFDIGSERREQRQWRQVFEALVQPMVGHHGQPPKTQTKANTPLLLDNFFAEQDIAAAREFFHEASELLLGQTSEEACTLDPKDLRANCRTWSWWLAGFAVLCDWIGSNQDHFSYQTERMDLAEYWTSFALPRAGDALLAAGVLPTPSAAAKPITALFPHIRKPTPLQASVAQTPLFDGPQLFILEDVTGAGKTEAAMMLVHRLMSAGLAEGTYIALPTMATANAMYDRMADGYHGLFASGTRPSLILAHGARELMERFRQSVLPAGASDLSYDADSATAQCSAWLADQRKKALLANVGVGTIDQALLGVLFSRHQSLRLLGLLGKVLVVDEVHACDAYVIALLRKLLVFHAASGGSAVLLTATLPLDTRDSLVAAFATGANLPRPQLASAEYPLLTHVGAGQVIEEHVTTRPEVRREVAIDWLAEPDAVLRRVSKAAAAGQCVCWIRNTVADALEARDALADIVPAQSLHLFHARYAMGDRLDIEDRVLKLFGKESRAEVRAGQILIATQVVEQSLDLDFDVMISDLAPIDLLIQRAGRLHRHRRDASGNPVSPQESAADGRGGARLAIHGPEPVMIADEDWFKDFFPRGAYVYPDHARLWLGARLLHEKGGFRMPEDARRMIEGVYAEDATDSAPTALQGSHFAAGATAMVDASLAHQNSLDLHRGYVTPALDWWDDTVTPTRLGEPTSTVRLAQWHGGRVLPWAKPGRFAWQRSEVSMRQSLVASEASHPEIGSGAIDALKESMPDEGKWSLLVVLAQEQGSDVWHGAALDGRGRPVTLEYSHVTGLSVRAAESA